MLWREFSKSGGLGVRRRGMHSSSTNKVDASSSVASGGEDVEAVCYLPRRWIFRAIASRLCVPWHRCRICPPLLSC